MFYRNDDGYTSSQPKKSVDMILVKVAIEDLIENIIFLNGVYHPDKIKEIKSKAIKTIKRAIGE